MKNWTAIRASDLRPGDMVWARSNNTSPSAWHIVTSVSHGRTRTRLGFADGSHVTVARHEDVPAHRIRVVPGGLSPSATAVAPEPPPLAG